MSWCDSLASSSSFSSCFPAAPVRPLGVAAVLLRRVGHGAAHALVDLVLLGLEERGDGLHPPRALHVLVAAAVLVGALDDREHVAPVRILELGGVAGEF